MESESKLGGVYQVEIDDARFVSNYNCSRLQEGVEFPTAMSILSLWSSFIDRVQFEPQQGISKKQESFAITIN